MEELSRADRQAGTPRGSSASSDFAEATPTCGLTSRGTDLRRAGGEYESHATR